MDIREATSTLFNLATKYQDDKAIEAVLLVEEKFTSTNKQNTLCQHRFVVFTTEVRCGDCGAVYQRWDE